MCFDFRHIANASTLVRIITESFMKSDLNKPFGSFMNKTKWKELLIIIDTLPFPPAFIVKYLNNEIIDKDYLESLNTEKVYYYGDWSLETEPTSLPGIDEFNSIEYIKIKPSFSKRIGKYAKDETLDISEELRFKLLDKNIFFETDGFNNIIIYGYR